MGDEYLWDRSGPPDADVEELERLLAPLAQRMPPAPLAGIAAIPARRGSPASFVMFPLAAAATLALAVSPLWLRPSPHPATPAWEVVELEGAASIASRAVRTASMLAAGQTLRTGAHARVALQLGPVGYVEVGPSTEVSVLPTAEGRYRFRLHTGALTASIWADPGQFFVETRSSLAIDLGCKYTLTVDEHGEGTLRVTTGWVGFQTRERQSLIPAEAMCRTRPGVGPGTPYFEDAPEVLRAAVEILDFGRGDPASRAAALDRALDAARPRDALTLWHLLQRVDRGDRDRVYDRLAAFVPPPAGVTREGVRDGDRRMLEQWWDHLGYGDTQWWQLMSRPWADTAPR